MVFAQARVSVSVVVSVVVAAVLAQPARALAQSDDSPSDPGAVPSGISGAVIRPAEPAKDAPKKPVIVLPELTHFEHADYPPEAEKAGLQAEVTLKLTVDREGNVSKADVPAPVGNGFDEAAQAAALKFKFTPATRDGVPIPVVIPYRYSFTLTPKPAAVAPPPAPTTGNLVGGVRLADTNSALVGATVTITLRDGSTRQVVSDETGKWQFRELRPANTRYTSSRPAFRRSTTKRKSESAKRPSNVPLGARVGGPRNHRAG